MCGRYQFTAEQCEEIRQIAEAIQRKYGAGAWTPGEIRPSNHAPVLLDGAGGPVPKLMKWGYQLPGTLVINARAETAAEKPLFRDSVRSRRCLIPSTGFYEWDGQKRKYLFTLPREGALYMAGLYDRRGNEDCYCILTTSPNASMRPFHDRMPLILTGEQRHRWLADDDAAARILTVVPPELMRTSAEAQISLWYGSGSSANQKRLLLHGAELEGRGRQEENEMAVHRYSGCWKEKSKGGGNHAFRNPAQL